MRPKYVKAFVASALALVGCLGLSTGISYASCSGSISNTHFTNLPSSCHNYDDLNLSVSTSYTITNNSSSSHATYAVSGRWEVDNSTVHSEDYDYGDLTPSGGLGATVPGTYSYTLNRFGTGFSTVPVACYSTLKGNGSALSNLNCTGNISYSE